MTLGKFHLRYHIYSNLSVNFTDPNAWQAHLPPLSVGEEDREIVESLDVLAKVLQILDIPDASFIRLMDVELTLRSSGLSFFSTAIQPQSQI